MPRIHIYLGEQNLRVDQTTVDSTGALLLGGLERVEGKVAKPLNDVQVGACYRKKKRKKYQCQCEQCAGANGT